MYLIHCISAVAVVHLLCCIDRRVLNVLHYLALQSRVPNIATMRCMIAAVQFTATADLQRNFEACSRLIEKAFSMGAKVWTL